MLEQIQNMIKAIRDWSNSRFQKKGNYALVENAGYSLALNIDKDYVMTIELKNADGDVLSSKSIDFPIESMVVGADYADGELLLTLQNGQELPPIDISDIVKGLVKDSFTIAGIDMKDNITKEELATALGINNKVDKVDGKGLSTNDYTTEDKNKLSGIASNANNYSLPTASSSVKGGIKTGYSQTGKNYPVQMNGENAYVNVPWENTTYSPSTQSSNGLMSSTDKSKLDGIATGAEVNVQSDWNVTDTNSDAYIKNKPTSLPANGGTASSISETLPISKGGTGKTTAKDAANTLINSLVAGGDSAELTDDNIFISASLSETGVYAKRKLSKLWNYIKTKAELVFVKKSGDKMTGNLEIEKSSDNANIGTSVRAKRTDTNTSVFMGVGSSGINHGIYSDKLNKWIAYADDVGVHLNGNADTATKATALNTPRRLNGVLFDGSSNISNYAECSTAAATAAKVVSKTGFELVAGARITIKFTTTNTAANPTLNVNGTGAKAIQYRGAAIAAGYLAANRTYDFVYDGTCYQLVGDINTDTNTTYSPATQSANGLMSSTDKSKLDGIATGAEVNVQADWNATDTNSDDFIKNKPSIPSKTSDLTNDSNFASTVSPTFTGTPKAPTPTAADNSTRVATTAYVKTLISNLVNGAPETLDTLKEIADALGENDDVVQGLNAAIGNKVDKSGGTMTGSLIIDGPSIGGLQIGSKGQAQVACSRYDNNGSLLKRGIFQISNGNNLGIYDVTNNKWMCYSGQDGVAYFKGIADTSVALATARTIFGKSFNGSADVAGKGTFYGTATDTANQRFKQSALEIRENDLIGNTSTDIKYAPSIGFHWSNVIGASLRMDKAGAFNFLKQDGVSAAATWGLFISKDKIGIEDNEGRIYYPIQGYGDGAGYGQQLVIGAGGNTFIGSGESAGTLYNAFQIASNLGTNESYSKISETMYISSDSGMLFYVNANTAANRKGFKFGSDGVIEPVKDTELKLGSETNPLEEGYFKAVRIPKSSPEQPFQTVLNGTDVIGSQGKFFYLTISEAVQSSIKPYHTNAYTLGDSDYRWKQIWSNAALNTSSDRKLKKDIKDLASDKRYIIFFMLLMPKSYLFKDGESGRTHVGFISQDVEDAMEECGLSSREFAGFCKDQKKERVKELKEITHPADEKHEEEWVEEVEVEVDKPVFDDEGNPVYEYSLRYEEFIALNTMMIQKQQTKIDEMNERLEAVEERLANV